MGARFNRSQDDESAHETKLGPNVILSVKNLSDLRWGTATVMRNDAQSLDGSIRLLHLSVADHVDMLYGRRVKGVPDASRWIESYTVPGQTVGVRLPGSSSPAGDSPASSTPSTGALPRSTYAIASTPYASRRDSAYVDASLIEILVDRTASPEDAALAELGPGAQLEVTQVIGRGFSSLLDSYNGLQRAIEEGRNLLLIGLGSRGASALRSALCWQPVLAHASSHRVVALYVAHSATRAAFVAEWDSWREAGITLRPLYTHPNAGVDDAAVVAGGGPGAAEANGTGPASAQSPASPGSDPGVDHERVMDLLQQGLFMHEGGFDGVTGGPSSRVCVLLAGLPGDLASAVAKQLSAKGVDYTHILFSDYF